jgi:hypothetical protein
MTTAGPVAAAARSTMTAGKIHSAAGGRFGRLPRRNRRYFAFAGSKLAITLSISGMNFAASPSGQVAAMA